MSTHTKLGAVTVLDEHVCLSLGELCRISNLAAEDLITMVEEGLLHPSGHEPRHWRFPAADLRRVQVALRLQHDLGVNFAGAAVVLDLLEERRALRQRLRCLERLLE